MQRLICYTYYTILSATAFLWLQSCVPDKESDTQCIVEAWIGKQIKLPNSAISIIQKDTVERRRIDSDYILLRYIDSTGCSSCRLKIPEYITLAERLSNETDRSVELMCITSPKDVDDVVRGMVNENVNFPVMLDTEFEFQKANNLEESKIYHTMLLDHDYRVVAIGDPLIGGRIYDVYRSVVEGNSLDRSQRTETKIIAKPTSIDLGSIKTGDSIITTFTITNIGNADFVVDTVMTSCYCTDAFLDKTLIHSGESARLTVTLVEESAVGDFFRLVDIYGNINEELTLEITGTSIP